MKKTILWGALFTLICSPIYAEIGQLDSPTSAQNLADASNTATPVGGNKTAPVPQPTIQNNFTNQNAPTPSPMTQPAPTIPPTASQPLVTVAINCDYKIPAQTKTIDQTLILAWSQHAAIQAFQFDPNTVDAQLQKLQNCFTEQGWVGFNSALQKSGNIDAIKAQKLNVISNLDGTAQMTESKDNQWKVAVPLKVLYQNDKEQVNQLLNVNLTIGRKVNGDLGIMQVIAMPRIASANTDTSNPQPQTAAPTTPANPAAAPSANPVNPVPAAPATQQAPTNSAPATTAPNSTH